MPTSSWVLWAFILIAQNFAFTFVSRARNSGSLKKHLTASVLSNGIWFVSQIFAVGAFMSILSGQFGVGKAIAAGVFYTVFTILGSLLAHQHALKTEKGNARVGAHKDIATFTKEEGDFIRNRTLTLDTGDGDGTFTGDEIVLLKELVGEQLPVVEETVTMSFPGAGEYDAQTALNGILDGIKKGRQTFDANHND